jgi:hypothetical protein
MLNNKKTIDIFLTKTKSIIVVWFGLLLITWLAYFYGASYLGLYQDDVFMVNIVKNIQSGVLIEAFDFSKGYGGAGRQGNQVILVLFTWLGLKMGGILGLYFVNLILISAAGLMVFLIFRRFFTIEVSFLTSIFCVLLPADSAKFFAVSYMSNISLVMYWGAALALIKGRLYLALLLLLSIFSIFEAYLLPGLFLPLIILARKDNIANELKSIIIKFTIIYVAMMTAVVFLRLIYAPGRASEALQAINAKLLIVKMLQSILYGSQASFSAMYLRVPEFINLATTIDWTIASLALFSVYYITRYFPSGEIVKSQKFGDILIEMKLIRYLILFGVLSLFAAYPLYGLYPARFPPSIIDGKMSNIHGPAGVGMVTLFGIVVHLISKYLLFNRFYDLILKFIIIFYLSIITGYFSVVQHRYIDAWRYQLGIWKELPIVASGLSDKSLVVLEEVGNNNPSLEGGSVFDWSTPYLLQFMWRNPSLWRAAPLIMPKWAFDAYATVGDGVVEVKNYPTLPDRVFNLDDVITLKIYDGRLLKNLQSSTQMLSPGFFLSNSGQSYSQSIVANNFSDHEWLNGVMNRHVNGGGMFYYITSNHVDLKVGSRLKFKKSGIAKILSVDVTQQGDKSAVFVTVDILLNPIADGYPNFIQLMENE